MRKLSFIFFLITTLVSPLALAGGGGGAKKSKFKWKESGITQKADAFVAAVSAGDYSKAYAAAGDVLRRHRTLEEFTEDVQKMGLDKGGSVEWESGNNALQAGMGFKLMGTYTPKEGDPFPVYMHLEGDAHIDLTQRRRDENGKLTSWNKNTQWTVMDFRSAQSMTDRIQSGTASGLDWFLFLSGLFFIIALIGLSWFYIRGLRGHPRELWLMFFTKLTEYSAYGAAGAIFILFLQQEVTFNGEPLGDSFGYQYYLVWGIVATIISMTVGAVCDTIGVKKCLLIGAFMLLISRFFMPLSTNIYLVTLLGFLPLAFGFAITGPVLKVGIKWFTTLKTATLGFGLFYTLMNVGFTIGAILADYFRKHYADGIELPIVGVELTAYQAIIGIGFLINIPDLIAILIMREGAEMTESGFVIRKKDNGTEDQISAELRANQAERKTKMIRELKMSALYTGIFAAIAFLFYSINLHTFKIHVVPAGSYVWAFAISFGLVAIGGLIYATSSLAGANSPGGYFDRVMKSVRDSTEGTIHQLKENLTQKPFLIYMGMLGILTFVRLAFYIFHTMFQPYAVRVFGDDFPIASLFGTLNPAMIVFLVPLISILTIKVRSYTMLMVGTSVSALSVFLCFLPTDVALWFGDTWFGTAIYEYWVEAPEGGRDPFLMSLIIFIIVFTIGEAIWSPRLMQFSAEIAPRGKEGAYIALAVLPYFFGKIAATVMADILTNQYFNSDMVEYPAHQEAWFWIAIMCMLSPIGMVVFRKTFNQSEKMAEEEAKATMEIEGGNA